MGGFNSIINCFNYTIFIAVLTSSIVPLYIYIIYSCTIIGIAYKIEYLKYKIQ